MDSGGFRYLLFFVRRNVCSDQVWYNGGGAGLAGNGKRERGLDRVSLRITKRITLTGTGDWDQVNPYGIRERITAIQVDRYRNNQNITIPDDGNITGAGHGTGV